MKIPAIHRLDKANEGKETIYGKKIGVLSKLVANGVNVPDGYYFTIDSNNSSQAKSNSYLEEILSNLKKTKDTRLIVRSSMSLEDQISHQFPGIFLSQKDVCNFDELKLAVRNCIKSKKSELALRYVDTLKSVSLHEMKVAILVQEQIKLQYFGLAEIKKNDYSSNDDYINVEITKKDSFDLVQGAVAPSAIRIYRESNYEILSSSEDIEFSKLNIHSINRELWKVKKCFPYDSIVEFGIDNYGTVFIFQAREHEIKGINPLRSHVPNIEKKTLSDSKKAILPNERLYGLKGAAMKYFQDSGLFEEPLLLIDSNSTLNKIKKILAENTFCDGPLTLRFSKGDEIGLKRIFASNRKNAFGEIVKYYPNFRINKQLLIIHPYLNVKHSYELLIENDFFVLEHIPGLWEANNVLEPDVIFFDTEHNRAEMLIVKDSRQEIISTPYSTDREFVSPLSFEFLEKRLDVFYNFYMKLKDFFFSHLPLNFHFIETQEGKIAFLNIRRLNIKRKMFENRRYVRDGSFFHVRNEEDLEDWDERSPILLRLSTERGKEKDFISLALNLPKNVDIYINFGWLSHPAMILREYGVHVIPAYLDRNIKTIDYVPSGENI